MNLKKIYAIRYILYLIIIVFVSTYLILLTYGYRINWANRSLQKISMMYLASIPQDVDVYMNSKLISDSTPVKITNLFPGRYDIKIENSDYESWEKTFFIQPDFVSQEQDIILILKNKENIVLSDSKKEAYIQYFKSDEYINKDKKNLYIKNGSEIYFDDLLIARLSKDVKNVSWYADKKHIFYQLENKIYFMDTDGTNNVVLVELSSDNKADFKSSSEGGGLIYDDNGDIKEIKITNITSLFKEKYFNRASKIIQ